LVKSEYDITYDGNEFIIHRAAKGFPDLVFKPHTSGLHVYDLEDARGLASYPSCTSQDAKVDLKPLIVAVMPIYYLSEIINLFFFFVFMCF